MDEETQRFYAGKIIALELLMRGLLYRHAAENGWGPEDVTAWKADTLGSFQFMGRQADDEADAIWAEAVEALDTMFEQVAKRLAYNQGRA